MSYVTNFGAGSGGSADFLGLLDTPSSYAGQSLKYIRVKASEDGLEFSTVASSGDFLSLTDTPSSFTSQANKLVSVNVGETALEFIAVSSLSITESQISDLGAYLTAVTADSPLSGSGTSGSHLTLDTSGTWSGNAATATSAGKWTTARTLAGNSVDGSANVAFSNKFIVQGTTDAGLSGAQFLGALSTGIVKNTTSTGVLSIASAGTDYEVPLTFSTGLTRTTNTITVNTSQNISTLSNLTSNGFIKTSGGTGALSIDTSTYLTGNQTITLSGDTTGSGATSITTTLANTAVTPGSYTNADITVDSKGRITAASNGSAGGSSDHTTLSNLGWTASGHTGTASRVAGFSGAGAASEFTTSGSGTVLALTTSPSLTTPTLGAATATSIAIGANTLDTTEWAYLDGQDQSVFTTSTPTFNKLTLTGSTTTPALLAQITNNSTTNTLRLNAQNSSSGAGIRPYATTVFYAPLSTGTTLYNTGRIASGFASDGSGYNRAALVLQAPTADATWTDALSIAGSTGAITLGSTLSMPDELTFSVVNKGITFTGASGTPRIYGRNAGTKHIAIDANALYGDAGITYGAIGNVTIDAYSASTSTISLTNSGAGVANVSVENDLTVTGDVAVNGGDLTSSASTFNLLATPTTLNIGAAVTTGTIATSASNTNITYGASTGGTKTFIFDVGSTKQGSLLYKHQGTSKWALYSTDPTDSLRVYSYTNGADLFTFAPTLVTSAQPITSTGYRVSGSASSGTILRGNGTNYVASTATYPNTTTSTRVLYSTGTNTIGESANLTFSGSALTVTGSATVTTSVSTPSVILSATTRFPWQVPLTVMTARLPVDVTAATIDSGSLQPKILFDASTTEYIDWQFRVPSWYNSSQTLQVVLMWSAASATSGTCTWGVQLFCISDGDSADVDTSSFATATTAGTTTAGTAGYPKSTTISIPTNRDSMAGGDLCILRLYRATGGITGDAEFESGTLEAY